jgi:hypothetical protein
VIDGWEDLKKIFTDNFPGTFVCPGNSWDLKSWWQNSGECLRDYIRRFSQKCHKLPWVADADIISVL